MPQPAHDPRPLPDPLQGVLDRRAVIDCSYRYAAGIDHRDWDLFARCFTSPVVIDTSSFSGRPAGELTPEAWADTVRLGNGAFDATQHMMTNHVVTFDGSDEARCVNEVQAHHWFSAESMAGFGLEPAGAVATLVGHYDNLCRRVDGCWLISRCRLVVRYRLGDERVWGLARTRTASMARPPDPGRPTPDGRLRADD